jgi:cobalamin biosynthetic protein CobC
MTQTPRDHGGGLDAAIAQYGGTREEWLDLSTGINPQPYPLPKLTTDAWTALPDTAAFDQLIARARQFWDVPPQAAILPTPGASAAIAQLPRIQKTGTVAITGPTYNEHGASFRAAGWALGQDDPDAIVAVHPNNPDGKIWNVGDLAAPFCIIDESFCDVMPEHSLIARAEQPGTVILKSFGKFWGLAGLRLGFVIGDPDIVNTLRETLGPWQVSGPALQIGAEALSDYQWAEETRARLTADSDRLDALMTTQGAVALGGTALFRLYEVADAKAAQAQLAQHKIWSRIFPYSDTWLRLGLPGDESDWSQFEAAF